MSIRLALLLPLFAWLLSACSDPKCPRNLIQRGMICKKCPEGTVKLGNDCVGEEGGVVEPVDEGDGGPEDVEDSDAGMDGATLTGSDSSVQTGGDATQQANLDAAQVVNVDADTHGASEGGPIMDSSGSPPESGTPSFGDEAAVELDAGQDSGTANGLRQLAYFKASNADALDRFGTCLAISNDTLVVGAPGEDSGSISVQGNQFDNSVANVGAAFVFVRVGSEWVQQAYLKPAVGPNGVAEAEQHFGKSVAISADTIVVGANEAAWVFTRTSQEWSRTFTPLRGRIPTVAGTLTGFGSSVAVSGSTIVVGAPDDAIGGDSSASGTAYIFSNTSGTWVQQTRLANERFAVRSAFGAQVAIFGNTIAIGAPGDDNGATGVTNPFSDLLRLKDSGAVYVYANDGSSWLRQAYIKASNTGTVDKFGSAIALNGNTLLVGAPFEDSSSADQADNPAGFNAGAVYSFSRSGTTWSQNSYIKAPVPSVEQQFGASIALAGDALVVGAPGEAGGAGTAFLFRHSGNGWSYQIHLAAVAGDDADSFGGAIAASPEELIVGAGGEDSNAKGLGAAVGLQRDNSAQDSGAAYVFRRPF